MAPKQWVKNLDLECQWFHRFLWEDSEKGVGNNFSTKDVCEMGIRKEKHYEGNP